MAVTVSIDVKLRGMLKTSPKFIEILQASNYIVLNEAKQQSPVDKGDLRRNMKVQKVRDGYDVDTTATGKNNVKYPIFVHEGTKKLKGSRDYGFTEGRIRSNTVARGIGGVRPNKFMNRSANGTKEEVKKFVQNQINKLNK